jgi:hypothetical protein
MPPGTPSIRETRFQGQAAQRPIAQPVAFGSFVARHGAACPFGERARPECPGENEEEVRAGRFVLVVSDATLDELGLAPESVRRILADLPPARIEFVNSSEESNPVGAGHARSLHAGVVGPASRNDAAHIALATIFGAGATDWHATQSWAPFWTGRPRVQARTRNEHQPLRRSVHHRALHLQPVTVQCARGPLRCLAGRDH